MHVRQSYIGQNQNMLTEAGLDLLTRGSHFHAYIPETTLP